MISTPPGNASPITSHASSQARGTDRAVRVLEQAVADGALYGGSLIISQRGKVLVRAARGTKLPSKGDAAPAEAIEQDTVFDLDRLTSALCTTTLLMRLVAVGKVSLADRASRYVQALGIGQKAGITVAHLLSHSSGFPAGQSVYDELIRANSGARPGILTSSGAKQYAYNYFAKLPLKFEPGARQLHSDVNMILLGQICEVVTGLALDKAFHKHVAAPLQLKTLSFIDLALLRQRGLAPVVEMFAPAGDCPKRNRLIAGEVWDESAWVMGGVAGHAGLFGNAAAVHTWASDLLQGDFGRSLVFDKRAVRAFWSPDIPGVKAGWKLGFESTSRESGFVDFKVAPDAVTMMGNTGSSVFLDPARELAVVLLSNGGYSGHTSKKFLAARAELHTALLESL